jgi:hypothetical protein
LIEPGKDKKLEIRQGPEGFFVQDLFRATVGSFEEVNAHWEKARNNRTTFSNNVNEHSSRSHLVVSLYCKGQSSTGASTSFGKLHLIDLAGSERLSRTGATGDRLKEAQNINKSLSALGDVIQAAGAKAAHIPYRNSKLTHLLQDSLGSSAKTLMIVQSSPLGKDVSESLCSLQVRVWCGWLRAACEREGVWLYVDELDTTSISLATSLPRPPSFPHPAKQMCVPCSSARPSPSPALNPI